MKATKVIAAGLLIAAVLFLSIYALFPEESAEPVVSRITLPSSSNSKDDQALGQGSSEDKSSLNINTATEEELCQIDGITEELARLIVLYREKAGGYTSTEDLKKITQLGYNTYNKIKDSIYCE